MGINGLLGPIDITAYPKLITIITLNPKHRLIGSNPHPKIDNPPNLKQVQLKTRNNVA